ncbi:MAG: Sec-independent protein translocase protein TatB [Thermochromatium sp.]
MFDVGFQELIVVAIVALVVLGPERLPRAARVAGKWVAHARRTLATVKYEIDRELKAEELKRILNEQARHNPLQTLLEEPAKTTPRPEATTTEPQTTQGSSSPSHNPLTK